ncbi:hypothetical protein AFK68_06290, partial [Hydrocoleum sp. CS-953]|uniref:hypothetical protein n=1 Tax=Hydrocoleum sp. CS-953 TaxID=1671698 RepID=UPI000BC895BD
IPVVRNNQFAGIAYGSLDLSQVSKFLKLNTQVNGTEGIEAILVDGDNYIIADSRSGVTIQEKLDLQETGNIKNNPKNFKDLVNLLIKTQSENNNSDISKNFKNVALSLFNLNQCTS